MVYRAIGVMSGSSLDGLDLVFVELLEQSGSWSYEIHAAECYAYDEHWHHQLLEAKNMQARDYLLLHTAYGKYIGEKINAFIDAHNLHFKVALIASHGHTVFHLPAQGMTAQLGDGATIAAVTGLPVVSDLRNLDVAFGGQGAPIVPSGEQYLFKDYDYLLNIGGIANITIKTAGAYKAFDICPANRVLNELVVKRGLAYDKDGLLARKGSLHKELLDALNRADYYQLPAPKSLANEFGTETLLPLIKGFDLSEEDALRTYVAHIVQQVVNALEKEAAGAHSEAKMLVTGGGGLNIFLTEELKGALKEKNIELVIPDTQIVQYKEALVMALLGVLRWRQEYNTLSTVTGALRDSIGGALWTGQEA